MIFIPFPISCPFFSLLVYFPFSYPFSCFLSWSQFCCIYTQIWPFWGHYLDIVVLLVQIQKCCWPLLSRKSPALSFNSLWNSSGFGVISTFLSLVLSWPSLCLQMRKPSVQRRKMRRCGRMEQRPPKAGEGTGPGRRCCCPRRGTCLSYWNFRVWGQWPLAKTKGFDSIFLLGPGCI